MPETDALNSDFARSRPDAFARVLARGQIADVINVLDRLQASLVASIVARLPSGHILALLDQGDYRAGQWLAYGPLDDAAALLSRIPKERRLVLINLVADRKRRRQLLRQQRYPAHSVGALVRDVAARIPESTTVAQAIELLGDSFEAGSGAAIVVDGDGNYRGGIDFTRLATQPQNVRRISDCILPLDPVLPETSINDAAESYRLSQHQWLPVVDHQQRILGCVARADLLRAAGTQRIGGSNGSSATIDFLTDIVATMSALLDTAFGRRTGR